MDIGLHLERSLSGYTPVLMPKGRESTFRIILIRSSGLLAALRMYILLTAIV